MPKASHSCHPLVQNMVTSKYDPYASCFTVLAFTRQPGPIPIQIKSNAYETTIHTFHIPNGVHPCTIPPQPRSHSQYHLLSPILPKWRLNSQNQANQYTQSNRGHTKNTNLILNTSRWSNGLNQYIFSKSPVEFSFCLNKQLNTSNRFNHLKYQTQSFPHITLPPKIMSGHSHEA